MLGCTYCTATIAQLAWSVVCTAYKPRPGEPTAQRNYRQQSIQYRLAECLPRCPPGPPQKFGGSLRLQGVSLRRTCCRCASAPGEAPRAHTWPAQGPNTAHGGPVAVPVPVKGHHCRAHGCRCRGAVCICQAVPVRAHTKTNWCGASRNPGQRQQLAAPTLVVVERGGGGRENSRGGGGGGAMSVVGDGVSKAASCGRSPYTQPPPAIHGATQDPSQPSGMHMSVPVTLGA